MTQVLENCFGSSWLMQILLPYTHWRGMALAVLMYPRKSLAHQASLPSNSVQRLGVLPGTQKGPRGWGPRDTNTLPTLLALFSGKSKPEVAQLVFYVPKSNSLNFCGFSVLFVAINFNKLILLLMLIQLSDTVAPPFQVIVNRGISSQTVRTC